MNTPQPLIIGLAGGTGSGKTTVTDKILSFLESNRVLVIAHDSYYKDISCYQGAPAEKINFDHPDSLETSLLVQHLQQLRRGMTVNQPVYDFTNHTRKSETLLLAPRDIILVEGILIFVDKELRDLMDIKIFIDADSDERLARRIQRDIVERKRSLDSIMNQYISTVKPMHLEFVEPSKRWADIIIPGGAENMVAIDMVVTKIRSLMLRKSDLRGA